MKAWKVEYSIKHKDGEISEHTAMVEAGNITAAVGTALLNIREPLMKHKTVFEDVVIWDVGIITETDDPEEVF